MNQLPELDVVRTVVRTINIFFNEDILESNDISKSLQFLTSQKKCKSPKKHVPLNLTSQKVIVRALKKKGKHLKQIATLLECQRMIENNTGINLLVSGYTENKKIQYVCIFGGYIYDSVKNIVWDYSSNKLSEILPRLKSVYCANTAVNDVKL